MPPSLLDQMIDRLAALPPDEVAALARDAEVRLSGYRFIPSPGPQTEAYFSEADVLLYGGEPGGGKTGLLIGLALNEHDRSLIVRKHFADLEGVIDNAKEMLGTSKGFVGGSRPKYKKPGGGVVHFQGMAHGGGIDTGKQGTPHDFIGVDEGAQLPEAAITMLIGWNRTKRQGQRCRMVIASNPPTDSVGDWLADYFGPWLNPTHPDPAEPGELRWFVLNSAGKSQEVAGPAPVTLDGTTYYPHSRTYVPASVEDNPFIDVQEYRRRLQAMPEPYRTILLSGNFMLARQDDAYQVIPTAWVREAQSRWTQKPPPGVPMTVIGVDVAQGGADSTVLAARHDGWFAPLVSVPGGKTPGGREVAGLVVTHRRDGASVVIDMGGGYGGAAYEHLKDNLQGPHGDADVVAYKGAERAAARTRDRKLGFVNKRSEAWWKLREALDPSQPGGSPVMLPDDPMLVSDLTAPRFEIGPNGIKVEAKEDVCDRLGRSTDKGDAVVMCWYAGPKPWNRPGGSAEHGTGGRGGLPRVVLGHAHRRRH